MAMAAATLAPARAMSRRAAWLPPPQPRGCVRVPEARQGRRRAAVPRARGQRLRVGWLCLTDGTSRGDGGGRAESAERGYVPARRGAACEAALGGSVAAGEGARSTPHTTTREQRVGGRVVRRQVKDGTMAMAAPTKAPPRAMSRRAAWLASAARAPARGGVGGGGVGPVSTGCSFASDRASRVTVVGMDGGPGEARLRERRRRGRGGGRLGRPWRLPPEAGGRFLP